MKRLNIGCGRDIKEGWVNADIQALPGVDVVCDGRSLPFSDEEFDEMLAQDLLEHLPPSDTEAALLEWRRVLKPWGLLSIRVPDLAKIARQFTSGRLDSATAIWLIFGDQSPESGGSEWGSHKTGFTSKGIKELLLQLGFVDPAVHEHEHEYNLYIGAIKAGGEPV